MRGSQVGSFERTQFEIYILSQNLNPTKSGKLHLIKKKAHYNLSMQSSEFAYIRFLLYNNRF